MCQTADVVFHETFWAVIATVAPVIALAAVVSLGDLNDQEVPWYGESQKVNRHIKQRLPASPNSPHELKFQGFNYKYNRLNTRVLAILLTNLIVQATLLCVALISVADQGNLLPPVAPSWGKWPEFWHSPLPASGSTA